MFCQSLEASGGCSKAGNMVLSFTLMKGCEEKQYLSTSLNNNDNIQGSAKRLWQGLVNFVTTLAYHFCLKLLAAFMKPD